MVVSRGDLNEIRCLVISRGDLNGSSGCSFACQGLFSDATAHANYRQLKFNRSGRAKEFDLVLLGYSFRLEMVGSQWAFCGQIWGIIGATGFSRI